MSDDTNLRARLITACYVEGDYVLHSGSVSSWYLDKYQALADPALLTALTDALAALLPSQTQVLAGMETGGIVLATALSLRQRLPLAIVRKRPATHGTRRQVEGSPTHGRHVCLVEDVVTAGSSVHTAAQALREQGAVVQSAVCLVLRNRAGRAFLERQGVAVSAVVDLSKGAEGMAMPTG